MKRPNLIVLIGVLSIMMVAVACGDDDDASAPAGGPPEGVSQVLQWGDDYIPATQDALSDTNVKFHSMVYDRLLLLRSSGEAILSAAESWEVTNSTTWRFEIRQDLVFHDDTPLTAEDVAWSLRRSRDEVLPGYSARMSTITGATAVAPYTVEFTTDKPDSFTLGRLASLVIYPAAYFEKVGIDAYTRNPVGSGPYQYAEFLVGSGLTLERTSAEHPYRKVFLDQIKATVIGDPATTAAALKSGSLDGAVLNAPPQVVEQIEQSGVQIFSAPIRLFAAFWNVPEECAKGTPLCDPNVRKALIISVDREALTENIWRGQAVAASQPAIPGTDGYDTSLPIVFDPAKAEKLLDDAGYPRGADGIRFSIDYVYWFKGPGEDTVFAWQDMWKTIGVEMKAEFMEVGRWLNFYRRQDGLDQIQMMGIYLEDTFANNAAYLDRQAPTKVGSNIWYENDTFYDLRAEVFSEFDLPKRADNMSKALYEMSEWEDPAMWYAFAMSTIWALQPNVQGFIPEAGNQVNFDPLFFTS